jgi:hypothetical protein
LLEAVSRKGAVPRRKEAIRLKEASLQKAIDRPKNRRFEEVMSQLIERGTVNKEEIKAVLAQCMS